MASAAAHALTSGSLSSSLTRPHATSDSRLLTNLVKCEKALSSHLDEEVKAAHTASAALAAWGTSEAPDIAATANRLSNLLNAVADVQRTHVQAIEGYRSALKDVLDREQSIRTVVRDRDILVGRLIKASKKTKGTDAERAEKVNRAQRELHSCEQVLQAEESALIGVKRRTFKEALTMRMKTMGDAGAGMVDAARDAIILLDGFDTVGGGADMGNRGIMGNSDGMGHGMDESGEWEGEEDGRHQLNDPRMSAQFESASVTPSQSASQVQYGNRLNNQGPSQRYSTNLHDIGDASGPDAPEKNGNGQEDSDSESDDDYQEAFGGENLHRHSNVPPPHLLSAGAGTDNDFLPSAPRNLAPPNGNKTSQRSGNSPAPTPPRKDSASDLRKERAAAVAAHPQVPMPAIPTAPRFNVDGTNLGSIPRAPSMLVAGADAESSSDEDTRPTTQHRGGWGGSNTPSRPPLRAGRGGDNSSDEGGTVTSKRGGGKRSNSFFGKVGKLFKTDLSKQPTSGKESPRNTPERPRSNWDTRTDANLSSVRGHDSISRRTSVLRGPINPPEPDSSDEEDNRDVIRNVNPRRPLWQGEKASSDVGVGGGIGSLSKRPSMLKRSSSNATARITPGPMSSKAAEEAARRSVIGAGFAGTPSKPIGAAGDGTGSIKKKKKKKASSNAGSEVGTSATRTRASGPPPASSSGANDRTSIIVAGDASSGIRRSGSLSTGTGKGAAGSLSRTGTAQSIRSVDGGKKKRSSLANMSPKDGEGKFTTSSWIAKSETNPSVQNMTAAQAAANAGVVPKGSAAAVPTSAAVAPSASPLKVPKAPAPVHGSTSRGAPLKPALKAGSLSRSGSYSSSAGPSPAAILGPPVQAPPAASSIFTATAPPPMSASAAVPASTSLQGPPRLPELSGLEGEQQRPKAPESSLSIQEDKTFDGTGHLDVSLDGTPQKAAPVVTPTKKQSVPKLDMPTPEPFSFDLEARRGSSATGGTVSPGLMTPSQREAYERILGEGNVNEVSASPSRHLTAQPEGVTRTTDRSQKLSTSRVYSSGGGLVDDSSSESEQGLQDSAAPHGKEGSSEAARKAAEAQMSGAFSDEKSDPQLKGLSASIGTGQPASGGLHPAIKSSGPRSDTSSSAVGTGVERRKSVRMAPDTKLPPETPTGDTFDTTPRGGQSETKDPLAAAGASQSQLSSRIAPPPQAPPRLPNKEAQNQPIDLGRDRERSSWTTRIGQSNDDSSSDEDETGGGLDSYASARRAFGSASRHLGKATGEIKPKKKNEEEVASVKSGSKPKTKKKKEPANHGYNTAVPLPAGMEVVGRSPSVRKKK